MKHETDMKLPLAPEEITPVWLSEALQWQHPGIEVTKADVREIINGTSTKIRIALEYAPSSRNAALPSRLIVKGGFETHSKWMAEMYVNEARFYRDIRPYIDINTPDCYYAGSDPQSHQSIVIMEDLSERNVTFQNPLQPSSYAQIARRLEAMARYHAQTWNSAEFSAGGRFDWMTTRYQGFGKIFNARYLEPERWGHFMRLPRGAAVSIRLHNREWMANALKNLEILNAACPHCIIHGDTHLGNLYLEADGTPGFLDAQPCRAPWQTEVNYHLVVACDIADRPVWERALLSHYLAALKSYGIAAPDFPEAWDHYRRETAHGYFIFVINESQFQAEAVNTAAAARFAAAALDHDTIRLLS